MGAAGIEKRAFGNTAAGGAVDAFVLDNGNGLAAQIITCGGTITHLSAPDKAGRGGDVVLGFEDMAGYEKHTAYFGCIVGRVANRIAGGEFLVDGKRHSVPVNNGPNHLHGGIAGYDKRIWSAQASMASGSPALRLTLVDPDGAEGYPGKVDVAVSYTLTPENGLRIDYHATADRATPINLTNHSYFNLRDGGASDIGGHVLKIHGGHYTPVDAALIPNGRVDPVRGTAMDFETGKPIGRDWKTVGGDPFGYDHNFVLAAQDGTFARAADVYEPQTGRHMQVWTTEPGVQLYTANYLDGSWRGKQGIVYHRHCAFCLETQHFPDSVNKPGFPNTILRPGETFRSSTEYRFLTAARPPF